MHFILETSHFVYDGRISYTSSGEVVNLRRKIQLYISLWNSEINCMFLFLKCHVNVFTLLAVAAWSDLLISFFSYWKITYWPQNICYTKQTKWYDFSLIVVLFSTFKNKIYWIISIYTNVLYKPSYSDNLNNIQKLESYTLSKTMSELYFSYSDTQKWLFILFKENICLLVLLSILQKLVSPQKLQTQRDTSMRLASGHLLGHFLIAHWC